MTPELILLLQIAVPALLSFAAGHLHLILPNPLKNGGSPPAFPATIGHGEVISWLLAQLVRTQQPTPVPAPAPPATPAAPSTTAAILAELLTILKQALQAQPQPQPQPVVKSA